MSANLSAQKGPLTAMQIRLTVVDPLGPPDRARSRAASCDVLVTAPVGTALAAVAAALASAVPGDGSASRASDAERGGGPVVLYADGERLDTQRATLGEPPLVDGAVLSLGAPAAPEPHPELDDAPTQLHVVAGPDAGGVHLLHGGQIHIGRSADADVPLDDPDVSRLHCAVTVAGDGRVSVADLTSTNGTVLDGTRVGTRPVRFPPGALLRIGESVLRLAPSGGSRLQTEPDGEGHVRVAPGGAGQTATARGGEGDGQGRRQERGAPGSTGESGEARGGRGRRVSGGSSGGAGGGRAATPGADSGAGSAAGAASGSGARSASGGVADRANGPGSGGPSGSGDGWATGTGSASGAASGPGTASASDAGTAPGSGSARVRGAGDGGVVPPQPPTDRTHHTYGSAGWGASGGDPGIAGAQGHGPVGSPVVVPGQGGAPRIENRRADGGHRDATGVATDRGETRRGANGTATGDGRPDRGRGPGPVGDTHGGRSGIGSFDVPATITTPSASSPPADQDAPSAPDAEAPDAPGTAHRKGTPLRGTDVPQGVRRRGGCPRGRGG